MVALLGELVWLFHQYAKLNSMTSSLVTTDNVVLYVNPKWVSRDILGAAWAGGSTASV